MTNNMDKINHVKMMALSPTKTNKEQVQITIGVNIHNIEVATGAHHFVGHYCGIPVGSVPSAPIPEISPESRIPDNSGHPNWNSGCTWDHTTLQGTYLYSACAFSCLNGVKRYFSLVDVDVCHTFVTKSIFFLTPFSMLCIVEMVHSFEVLDTFLRRKA